MQKPRRSDTDRVARRMPCHRKNLQLPLLSLGVWTSRGASGPNRRLRLYSYLPSTAQHGPSHGIMDGESRNGSIWAAAGLCADCRRGDGHGSCTYFRRAAPAGHAQLSRAGWPVDWAVCATREHKQRRRYNRVRTRPPLPRRCRRGPVLRPCRTGIYSVLVRARRGVVGGE